MEVTKILIFVSVTIQTSCSSYHAAPPIVVSCVASRRGFGASPTDTFDSFPHRRSSIPLRSSVRTPGSMSSTDRGSLTARTNRRSTEQVGSTRRPPRRASQEGMGKRPVRPRARASKEFVMNEKWTPPRRPTTVELGTARKTFYELDRDGTGAIVRRAVSISHAPARSRWSCAPRSPP